VWIGRRVGRNTKISRHPALRPRRQSGPWPWFSGGASPSAIIYRQNYTDYNLIKKAMWELSSRSKEEWTISGFDGNFFRNSITVYGSPKIFNNMADAMIQWQTKGGNAYPIRAVFVSQRNSRDLLLIWVDGTYYGDNPIKMEHDSFNDNPGRPAVPARTTGVPGSIEGKERSHSLGS
jgi:hypothetical protein